MTAASWFREGSAERLLVVHPDLGAIHDATLTELPSLLGRGDLVVVNDAATFPASLRGRGPGGEPLELRLLAGAREESWDAVAFGAGDWRTRTEDRPPPPALERGARISFGTELAARVEKVDPATPRLLTLAFDRPREALWAALYALGSPVQYAHVARPLSTWHVQTPYAGRPWASELPSAGRALSWRLLLALRAAGIDVARLTHAAGLSSTGDAALDARLPLPERYEIPPECVAAWERARDRGRRIVAIGTSTVRALEAAALSGGSGGIVAGPGVAELVIGPGHRLAACSALLTGIHDPGTSHARLLEAFAPPALVSQAFAHAELQGYLGHELGDSCLLLDQRSTSHRQLRSPPQQSQLGQVIS